MSSVSQTPPTLGYPSPGATDARPDDREPPLLWGLPASAWLKILLTAGLLIALFRFNLARLWSKTNPFTGDPNWGHTVIIPLIGLYYLDLNRDRLRAAPVRPILLERPTRRRLIVTLAAMAGGALAYVAGGAVVSAVLGPSDVLAFAARVAGQAAVAWGALNLLLGWGLGNLLFGLLTFAFGIYPGQNDWVKDYGMAHTIFGTVLTLCGWPVMRVAWFPIAFLVCGIPWPGLVYSWLASPLQHLAAGVAVKTLNFTGIESVRAGTKMFITNADGVARPLNVAEACAGLRSLMTFISVAAAVAFLSARPLWQKLLITASAVPIAIFCNVMRVTGQAYLDRLGGPQWSEGFAHGFAGVVMLVPAFFLILLVCWLLDHLFIDEDGGGEEKAKLKAAARAKATAAAATSAAAATTADRKVIVIPPRVNLTGKPARPAAASPSQLGEEPQ